MFQYAFYPCDAQGNHKPEQAMWAELAGVSTVIDTMVNLRAPAYAVCAVRAAGEPTPMVYVKPAPSGGWDVWSNEILETEDAFANLRAALLDAADVVDEYIDNHANWS